MQKTRYLILLCTLVAAINCGSNEYPTHVTERANLLIKQMNLTQKIQFLHGVDYSGAEEMYVGAMTGIPELGIPDLKLNDGP